MRPQAPGVDCVHELGLACGIKPSSIATSSQSGLLAVYGTAEGRSCVLMASIGSPTCQV